jgi:adenosylcobinamide kinase/adenosylcobinamide-phosphate guanylyltransferase
MLNESYRGAGGFSLPGAVSPVPLTFITGPVRSGKSRFALRLARERESGGARVVYVATGALGEAGDREWNERIARHRAERDRRWREIETAAPGAPSLAEIARSATAPEVLVVDSTGTWLAARFDRMLEEAGCIDPAAIEAEGDAIATALGASAAAAIVVGDEVGWGIVPEYPSGRLFRDLLGRFHQRLALEAERAYLVVAGRALDLDRAGIPI